MSSNAMQFISFGAVILSYAFSPRGLLDSDEDHLFLGVLLELFWCDYCVYTRHNKLHQEGKWTLFDSIGLKPVGMKEL